jgi:hypothetical protein
MNEIRVFRVFRGFKTWVLCLVLLVLQCRAEQNPGVEKIEGESRTRLPLSTHSLTGLRDGETVNINVNYRVDTRVTRKQGLQVPDSLILAITLRFGVPTTFDSGRFRWYQKAKLFEGPLNSPSITYHGGQGALPSLAGRFNFVIAELGQYEVYIPATEIHRP